MQSIRGARRRHLTRLRAARVGNEARATARRYATGGEAQPKRRLQLSGQAIVEFALILPIFMLLLVIAIDFGRVFFTYIQMNNAAREAANYAAQYPTDGAGILAIAQQETNTQGQVGPGGITVTTACHTPAGTVVDCAGAAGANGAGDTITVSVQQDFSFITPFVNNVLGSSWSVNTDSTATVMDLAASGGNSPGGCTTAPSAFFTVNVSGLTVDVNGSGSTPVAGLCAISGYNWDMGDGANPNPPIVGSDPGPYTYSVAGTYWIQLEVTNPFGYNISQIQITVGATPTATPSVTPTAPPTPTGAPGSQGPVCNTAPGFTYEFTGKTFKNKPENNVFEITFHGSYTGQPAPAAWSWNFGQGGSTGSGQTVSHTYGTGAGYTGGTYTVTLTVSNGSCQKTVSQTVVVPGP